MKPRKFLALALVAIGFSSLWFLRDFSPVVRLAASSLGLIWIIKVAAFLWQGEALSPAGYAAFFMAWPGVSVSGFSKRISFPPPATGDRFLESWVTFLFGFALLICSSLLGKGENTILNYISLFSILLIVHLGLVEIAADSLRLLGFSPSSLFDRPFLASSLRDFWSIRWNRAFVDMNKIFLLGPLRDRVPASLLMFSIFLVSGVLHELAISYSDGQSWGHPLLYFVAQGIGMELEKYWKFPRGLVWIWILLPVPLLFTPTFTNLFLGDLGKIISVMAHSLSKEEYVRTALLLGGAAHMLVLCASVQVPGKLGWKQEFAKLTPLNRKVFWTYGAYILSIIVLMGGVSVALSQSDSLHTLAGVIWISFIALFWWARVLTDFFYFSHSDWPKGPLFTVGHVCLTTLFITLAVGYATIAILI